MAAVVVVGDDEQTAHARWDAGYHLLWVRRSGQSGAEERSKAGGEGYNGAPEDSETVVP